MQTLAEYIGLTTDQMKAITSQAFDLLEAGDLDGAEKIFQGLQILDPNNGRIQAALGSVFHQQGKLSEAEKAYDSALENDAQAVLARVNRGQLRCQRGDIAGLEDLRLAAAVPSAVQGRAQQLLARYQG